MASSAGASSTAVRDSRAPVVAAVNGICQAGGLLIAMLADIAVASDRATFRVPELLRGIPDATYAAVLPAHAGLAVARDLLRDAAVQAVTEILQTAPIARAQVKRMLNDRYGLIDYQMRAFMEKRPPALVPGTR
ncbi:MAG TPA: enoyl-CoA hydratase/isomerase family protein [Trebonia sp.]|nr:enoyl-CoA hydratase/isomerase family protein [Trebonia sp.]